MNASSLNPSPANLPVAPDAQAIKAPPPPQSSPSQSSRLKSDDGWAGPLFALPHLILFAIFVLGPVIYGFYISLHQWHVLAKVHPMIGLSNYSAALRDDIFWTALRNTIYFVVLVVPLGNMVSLALALGVATCKRFGTVYKVLYYLPVIISIAVVAVLWRWLYNTQNGLLNAYLSWSIDSLRALGLPLARFEPLPWLSDPKFVMPSIALMSIWWGAGGNMVLYLAGLNNIPDDYYEAAALDGAHGWKRFRHITWPLLRPTTLFCLVFSVLGAFQVFGQTYVLFAPGSGPARSGLTLALYMFQQGFGQYEIGYGAAIAYLIFAIVLLLTVAQFRLLNGDPKRKSEA